jgi:hypothetical protein
MLKQLVQAMFIHIPNNKASGMGDARDNCETVEKVKRSLNATESCGKQWLISRSRPKYCYVRMNIDLNTSPSVPRAFFDSTFPMIFVTPGMTACRWLCLATIAHRASKKPNLTLLCSADGSGRFP